MTFNLVPYQQRMGGRQRLGSAARGAAPEISATFESPLVIDSGRYFHLIVQVPVGAATASQVIRGDLHINGYFE